MLVTRTLLASLITCVVVTLSSLSFAEPLVGKPSNIDQVNLDTFFRNDLDIKRLVFDKNSQVLNLMAQMKDPSARTDNVNQFDQFIAIGALVYFTKVFSVMSEFDKLQTVSNRRFYGDPWVGVFPFSQSDIPTMSFQEGLRHVKQCMAKQGHTLQDKIARIVLYKAILPPNHFVYDYIFPASETTPSRCQEVLYLPTEDFCTYGLIVNCHFEVNDTSISNAKFYQKV